MSNGLVIGAQAMLASWTSYIAVVFIVFVMLQQTYAFDPEVRCIETCRRFQNEQFNNHCPHEDSCNWQCAAQRMNCSLPYVYHCAREYGHPEQQFVNGCAIAKKCRKGEEPAISFTIDTKPVSNTQAAVNCVQCMDKQYYNDRDELMSSTYSQCLYRKYNQCMKENHKIDCGPERRNPPWNVQTAGEGFCRCDARDGYEPKFTDVLDDGDYCFYRNVECVKKVCVSGMELSLNYKCIPKCADGYGQTQLSDTCTKLENASTAATNVSDLQTTTNRTESVTTSAINQSNTLDCCVCKKRNKNETEDNEEALLKPNRKNEGTEFSIKMKEINEESKMSPDKSLESNPPHSTKEKRTTIINYHGDVIKIKGGTANININSVDQKSELANETGTGIHFKLKEGSGDSSRGTCISPSIQVPSTQHSSSVESSQSIPSATSSLPTPAVFTKGGQLFRSDVQTEIRKSVVTQPSDEHDQDTYDSNVPHVKLPLLTPTMKQEEGHKPEDITQGPDFDVDVGVDAAGHALSCQEMDNLAREMLNWLNEYLSRSMGNTETDLAQIKANLETMAAEKNVNLDEMLNFPECVVKPLERWKEIFICKNCQKEFIVGNSSGKYNKCLYQSVSLLLCGDENLQNQLCLCSLLHAVKWNKDYVKQLEACVEREKSPWLHVQQILLPADIQTGDADWKLCLREGIRQIVVQTSESTTDSCELHIMFLSHALGRKITLHCQDSHRLDREECPVLPQYLHEETKEKQENLEDLHILWRPEHFMPLFERLPVHMCVNSTDTIV